MLRLRSCASSSTITLYGGELRIVQQLPQHRRPICTSTAVAFWLIAPPYLSPPDMHRFSGMALCICKPADMCPLECALSI